MARFVEDLVLALPIIAGVDGHDPATVPMPLGDPRAVDLKGLRVAFYEQLPLTFDKSTLEVVRKTSKLLSDADSMVVSPTPKTVETVRKAAKVLAEAGMAVEEDRPPGSEQSLDLWYRLSAADGGAGLKMFLQMIGTTEVHPIMQGVFDSWPAYAMSTTEFIGWIFRWDMFRSAMLSFMDKYDVLLCPVNAYPAPPHGISFDTEKFPGFVYPMTYNLTGWPAVVVRGGTSPEGLPIGVQIVARPWREDVALAVAQHIETALGGWQRPLL
jgi:amidase